MVRKHPILTIVIGLIVLQNTPVNASDKNGQAGSFLRIGLGPKARGSGDAYTAVADNAFAPYYNAAGVGFLEHREAVLSFSLLSFDRTFNYVGFAQKLPPRAGFAFGILQSGFRDGSVRTVNGERTGELIEDTQYTAFFDFAVHPHPKWSVGIVPKLIYSTVYDVSASSFGIDLGFLVKPNDRFSAGLSLQNLFQKLKYKRNAGGLGDETTTDRIPLTSRLGVSYVLPMDGAVRSLHAVYDLEMIRDIGIVHHVGMEGNFAGKVLLRAGIDGGNWAGGFSVPFEWQEKKFRVDYAYIYDRRAGIGFGSQDIALNVIF